MTKSLLLVTYEDPDTTATSLLRLCDGYQPAGITEEPDTMANGQLPVLKIWIH